MVNQDKDKEDLQSFQPELLNQEDKDKVDFHSFQPELLNQEDNDNVSYQPELLLADNKQEHKVDFRNYQRKLLKLEDIKEDKVDFHPQPDFRNQEDNREDPTRRPSTTTSYELLLADIQQDHKVVLHNYQPKFPNQEDTHNLLKLLNQDIKEDKVNTHRCPAGRLLPNKDS